MSVTIKDVAKQAGVSIATVSKIINNKPSISEATRQHVFQVMKEMNYLPNTQASNFARKRSDNIIFLAVTKKHTAFHDPHMFEILCDGGCREITISDIFVIMLLHDIHSP